MNKLTIIIAIALLVAFGGCSKRPENETNNEIYFDVVNSNVRIWEDAAGKYNIILAYEVSNLINKPLYFKESDFDIVDENGNLIDTMKSVSAYPPIINSDETAVYYDAKISDKISDANIKLKAIPHIKVEKSKIKRKEVGINGITGWRNRNAIGIIENRTSRTEYNNVQIAIISRTQSNEVVSVLTAKVDSIKPGEQIEFEAEDRLKQEHLGPDIVVTKHQNFAYVLP